MSNRIVGFLSALLALVALETTATEVAPAWQEPDFVMEEVVTTADSRDVAAARELRMQRIRMAVQHARRIASGRADLGI